MQNRLSVSVFVPVKNAEKTIKQCINSLLSQTLKPQKIYVIDNMSTDATYYILKSFGKKIELKRMPGTVPKLHNQILNRVKTKYLAYTNADCVVDKNWLKNLLSGFTLNEIVATAGFCATPKGLNKFQTIIGQELENRFKHAPKYVPRAPDMNLCVRTDMAKKVKFDERFIWSWESDFGFQLSKKGKILHVPSAVVYHYHRPNWKSFFRQQFNNAVINPILYWKHKDKIGGDYLSTRSMALSLFFAYLTTLFLLLSVFNKPLLLFSLISLSVLFLTYIIEALKITKTTSDIPLLFGIFMCRTVAWMIGVAVGWVLFIKNKWYKR